MIKYINKDITTIESGLICHGVNCQGVMGSGVAKAIRDKWPEVYKAYQRMPTGKVMLGSMQHVNVSPWDDLLHVANCYTQIFYGKGGRFADPKAIKSSMMKAYNLANIFDVDIYLPKIGAGLGGLNWEKEVEPIIIELDENNPRVETYVCVWGE